MTFKEYLAAANKYAEERPECLDWEVVTSIDDEGNGFNKVFYEPTFGNYDDSDKEFIPEGSEDHPDLKLNSVCLN